MCCILISKELTDDIGSNRFSLLLNENNDNSIIKLLGVSLIYLSHAPNKAESTYLGLAKLEKCVAISIEEIVSKLES